MPINIPRGPSADPIADANRLTDRDHLLLDWLAEHYLLSAGQISRALYPALRTAQRRLQLLTAIGAVYRYQPARGSTGWSSLYGLGRLGVLLRPHAYYDPDHRNLRPPRSDLERRARFAAYSRREHLLGTNEFFIRLHAHSRQNPQRRLTRWWSEQHATAVYADFSGKIRPDGHGIWATEHGEAGFFLEHDRGSETLEQVVRKLDRYEHLAEDGPSYAVLLHLHSREREAHLLNKLAERAQTASGLTVPVLTAVHDDDPAAQVWAMPGVTHRRLWLHEIPSSHGSSGPRNPAHPAS